MTYSIDNLISIVRFVAGLFLTIIAMRAYLRTRITAMLYLTAGFTLITIGDIFSTIYYINDFRMDKLLSNIFEIFGLVALIIAVKKS